MIRDMDARIQELSEYKQAKGRIEDSQNSVHGG